MTEASRAGQVSIETFFIGAAPAGEKDARGEVNQEIRAYKPVHVYLPCRRRDGVTGPVDAQ